jgi:transcriptional regulator
MANDTEIWKSIPVATKYEASSYGRIRLTNGKQLKPQIKSTGYATTAVIDNSGVRRYVGVHRLVLMAHCGMPSHGQQACHGNGARADNRLSNLRWGTAKDNHADKKKHGTELRHEDRNNAVLTKETAKQIAERLSKGEHQKDLAKEFGTSQSNISRIARGLLWSEITGIELKTRSKKRSVISAVKLTIEQVKDIATRAARGEAHSQLSREFKVSRTTVANIKDGKSWSHITNILPVQNGVQT